MWTACVMNGYDIYEERKTLVMKRGSMRRGVVREGGSGEVEFGKGSLQVMRKRLKY